MDSTETRNIAVVRRYFDGCNSGDLPELLGTLADDVVHYFELSPQRPSRGTDRLSLRGSAMGA